MDYSSLIPKAFGKRAILFREPPTDCFRLFNSDGDGIPGLCIDRYGEYILASVFSKELWADRIKVLREVEDAARQLPAGIRGLLVKDRRKHSVDDGAPGKFESELFAGSPPSRELVVVQDGIKAGVDLVSGQNTGLFLDMREIRVALKEYYRETDTVLNLFSYTGVFSVHALKYGAGRAVNVDLSKAALQRAMRNYELNGLGWGKGGFLQGDAFDLMRFFCRKGRRFSLVIYDPPTFSRNKTGNFSIKRDYRETLALIGQLAAGGLALTCVNTQSISMKEYRSYHPPEWENIFLKHESSDFPFTRRPYLKAGLWRIGDYRQA
jgi:23S rRNA (cytosine1962-C5)-methyltransferase